MAAVGVLVGLGLGQAVTAARREGEQRPLALFVAGARGFLRGSWEGRGLGSLFVDKDGPPGFELMRRTRGHEWLRKNSLLLHARDDAIGSVTVSVLTTSVMSEWALRRSTAGPANRPCVCCIPKP